MMHEGALGGPKETCWVNAINDVVAFVGITTCRDERGRNGRESGYRRERITANVAYDAETFWETGYDGARFEGYGFVFSFSKVRDGKIEMR